MNRKPTSRELGKLSQRYLKQDAYEAIKHAITNMELKPGEPCTESTIAAQLGISKTPVRHALDRLDSEGLVVTIPYKGTFVRPVSVDDVREVLEVRQGLEALAARLWIERVPPERIGELRALIVRAQESDERGDVDDATDAIRAFHDTLIYRCGNKRLQAIFAGFEGQMARIRNICGHIPGRINESCHQHRRITDAIDAKDAFAADEACRIHLSTLLEAYSRRATEVLAALPATAIAAHPDGKV